MYSSIYIYGVGICYVTLSQDFCYIMHTYHSYKIILNEFIIIIKQRRFISLFALSFLSNQLLSFYTFLMKQK